MSPTPLCLSPALPSELLSHVLRYHTYPTTLIICSSQQDFVSSFIQDIRREPPPPRVDIDNDDDDDDDSNSNNTTKHPQPLQPPLARTCSPHAKRALLSSPLYQVAASKHIRVVYAPTVTHLRAYLSVFAPEDSRVPAPPPASTSTSTSTSTSARVPSLLVYGFLALHRGTSEWSAQGLGSTASALAELAHRLAWRAVVVEPGGAALGEVLAEAAPVLSGGGRRGPAAAAAAAGEGGWGGRTVEVGRVLGRWFAFRRGVWDGEGSSDDDGNDAGSGERGERERAREARS